MIRTRFISMVGGALVRNSIGMNVIVSTSILIAQSLNWQHLLLENIADASMTVSK